MPSAFDRLAAQLDYPMTIVTCAAGGERSGCLVGFTTQCSIKPPRYLVCISKANHTHGVAERADTLAVHFPTRTDRELAALFGEETGDELDKFERCRWRGGTGGAPVLEGIGRWFAGPVIARHDLGDHVGFVVDIAEAGCEGGGEAEGGGAGLSFQDVKEMPPGHPV